MSEYGVQCVVIAFIQNLPASLGSLKSFVLSLLGLSFTFANCAAKESLISVNLKEDEHYINELRLPILLDCFISNSFYSQNN